MNLARHTSVICTGKIDTSKSTKEFGLKLFRVPYILPHSHRQTGVFPLYAGGRATKDSNACCTPAASKKRDCVKKSTVRTVRYANRLQSAFPTKRHPRIATCGRKQNAIRYQLAQHRKNYKKVAARIYLAPSQLLRCSSASLL